MLPATSCTCSPATRPCSATREATLSTVSAARLNWSVALSASRSNWSVALCFRSVSEPAVGRYWVLCAMFDAPCQAKADFAVGSTREHPIGSFRQLGLFLCEGVGKGDGEGHQQGHRQEGADGAQQPRAEGDGEEHGKGIELEP